jgi:predicted  nucleic acid-binding Zn-ribbon protein
VLPVLASLVALQRLDTAADAIRRHLAELPAAEQAIDRAWAAATSALDQAKAALSANQHDRRELEKQVAAVDTRLSRFEDHKASVKTNQEYTALLHEITTAKAEKNGIEEQILVLMEAAETLTTEVEAATQLVAATRAKGEAERAGLTVVRSTRETELSRLKAERAVAAAPVDATTLARYEKILAQRKMLAVTPIAGELCTACHVRLRPAVIQQIRRNEEIFACDSCQRILYAPPVADASATTA